MGRIQRRYNNAQRYVFSTYAYIDSYSTNCEEPDPEVDDMTGDETDES